IKFSRNHNPSDDYENNISLHYKLGTSEDVLFNFKLKSNNSTKNSNVTVTFIYIDASPWILKKEHVYKYNYKLNNRVSSFDKELYIGLDWNKTYGQLEIEDDRFSDYYFGRKVHNKVVKKLELPKDYKITHLPDAIKEEYKDISISINFKQVGNSIIYSNEIIIGSGIIHKDDFEVWNNLVKKLKEVYNDQIVITKIS
ncbi:MAG: hypothetical protein KAQ79_10220, partial [Cyclobacteriaceae bacterium]|nr:hypothetical protein [Cyclobacteriaceae bacterium]